MQGHKFKRQIPKGEYIVDFVCEAQKLVIEVGGGQHGEQIEYDEQRTQFLQEQGYRVLRFWNRDILTNMDGVLTLILSELGKVQE